MATQCGTVTVQAAFSSSNVYVAACNLGGNAATPGESVTVSVPVNNDNNTTADVTVELFVDGSSSATENITIGANSSETADFNFTSNTTGTFSLSTEVTSATRL